MATTESGLARAIRARMERLGMSQRAYADRLGIAQSHLSSILVGKINVPNASLRRRIAADLGISHLQVLVLVEEIREDEIPEPGGVREPFAAGSEEARIVEALAGFNPATVHLVHHLCRFLAE